MSAFLHDTFTGTNGALLTARPGEIGATWTLHPLFTGAPVIANDRIRNGTGNSVAYASGVPASADYDVSAFGKPLSLIGTAGVCGRMSITADTHYWARYGSADGAWQIFKFVAGVATKLGEYVSTAVVGTNYDLKLEMQGTSIKLYLDGVERVSVTDSDITAAGRAGVRFTTTGGDTTHFHVSSVSAGTPDPISARSGFGLGSRSPLNRLALPALSAKGGLGVGSSRSSPIVRLPLQVRSGFGVGSQSDLEFGGAVLLPGHEAPMRWKGALWINRNLDENSAPVLPRYEIARIAGRGDTAELESRREARTGARGEVFRRTLRRGKGETYEGAVIAGSLLELQRAVAELRAAFDDPREGRMEILPHVKQQGLFANFFFRAGEASLTVLDEQVASPSHSSLGWTRPFVLTLRLPDALYLESRQRKRTTGTIVAGATTVLCENRGTAAAEPTLVVWGPVPAPWTVSNLTAGKQLRFLTAIPSGSAVVIDFAKRSILRGGTVWRFDRATSTWWDAGVPGLLPGANSIRLLATGLVAPARLEVYFNHTVV